MGPLGVQEIIAIFVIALLLFGPKKLPELGRTLGKALSEFRRAKNELKATFESHLNELERETRLDTSSSTTTDYAPVRFPYPYDETGHYDSDYASYTTDSASESHESGVSQPSTSSATAKQEAEAHRDFSAHESSSVAGTVPRNGVQPSDGRPITSSEEHPA